MHFRKVKFDGETMHLEWLEVAVDDEKSHAHIFKSKEPPAAGFYVPWDDLVPEVVGLLGLHELYAEGMVVRGISFSYSKSGEQSAVITCLKSLPGIPNALVLNTPLVAIEDLPERLAFLVAKVEVAAKEYIGGKREQADMFVPDVLSGSAYSESVP